MQSPFSVKGSADSPIIACALHSGHSVRPELVSKLNLNEEERLREEDPFTDQFAKALPGTKILVHRSRFEVDLNRSPDKAIYQKPEDAWGLEVWKEGLSTADISNSRKIYHDFYEEIDFVIKRTIERCGCAIVYDIHSYNHRREGRDITAPQKENPQVNLGTGNVDKEIWQPAISAFLESMKEEKLEGQSLDVRENVRFTGGYFSKYIGQKYGDKVCVFAVEFKKIFMDEWRGEPDHNKIKQLAEALKQTVQPVKAAIEDVIGVKVDCG